MAVIGFFVMAVEGVARYTNTSHNLAAFTTTLDLGIDRLHLPILSLASLFFGANCIIDFFAIVSARVLMLQQWGSNGGALSCRCV